MTPMDPRYHAFALELLTDATDLKTATRYADDLAQQLSAILDDFIENELAYLETEREESARDADDDARLAEHLGK